MKIEKEILNILDRCLIKENVVYLPEGQLDRKTYMAVNKCLEAIGGKWNRKEKGHLFEDDPIDIFENLLLTGEVEDIKKEFQFFETPKELVKQMIDLAELKEGDTILEPSAGRGAIANEIKIGKLFLNEMNEKNYKVLLEKYKQVTDYDFIEGCFAGLFDKIIMNPPFSKQQDIDHILRAFDLLKNGGILISIVSESPFFRENKKSVEFRKFLEDNNAEIIKNPDETFKESGTMVKTRIIKVIK